MNIKYYALSDIGRVRKDNQDDYLILKKDEKCFIAAVFDGVGGCDDGKKAAGESVRVLSELFLDNALNTDDLFSCKSSVEDFLYSINDNLRVHYNRDGRKLQTTGSVLLLTDKAYFVSNVGDSPVFLIREGQIFQITEDHNLSSERSNVLTQALGYPFEIEPFSSFESYYADDVFLICSDGLSHYVKNAEILDIYKKEQSIEDFVISLINTANSRGGSDNITAVSIRIE